MRPNKFPVVRVTENGIKLDDDRFNEIPQSAYNIDADARKGFQDGKHFVEVTVKFTALLGLYNPEKQKL